MRGFIYRLRMARARRLWQRAKRCDYRARYSDCANPSVPRRMAVILSDRARRIEKRALNGRLPR
jgi:hypothetical protein